jgi:hypothetical protein
MNLTLMAERKFRHQLFSRPRIIPMSRLSSALLALILLTAVEVQADNPQGKPHADAAPAEGARWTWVNKPIEPYREALLDFAFDIATKIPIHPYIKDRSRAQESVVYACLRLDQAARVAAFAEKIDNWRRGLMQAELAIYGIQRGVTWDVPRLLKSADWIADQADQDWRKQSVKIKIAQANLLLGQKDTSKLFDPQAAEKRLVEGQPAAPAAEMSDKDYAAELEQMDQVMAKDPNTIKGVMLSLGELHARFYNQADRRTTLEEKIKAGWSKLRPYDKISLCIQLAETALAHADQASALRHVNEAWVMVRSHQWTLEYYFPIAGRLSIAQYKAGDAEMARQNIENTLKLFEQARDKIETFQQASMIRPFAEAYTIMSDTEKAMSTYRRVVEIGSVNPNARTRAEDLTATGVSMALHGFEPDPALWSQMRRIGDGLVDPW